MRNQEGARCLCHREKDRDKTPEYNGAFAGEMLLTKEDCWLIRRKKY
jgi:hypothetical protein